MGRRWNNKTMDWDACPGVRTWIPDWPEMTPIESLNPVDPPSVRNSTVMFGPLADEFKALGYREGVDLLAPTYDWRDAPDEAWRRRAVEVIETAVNRTGQRAVVLGHSLGGPVGYYLLQKQSPEWLARYVEVFVPASPAWSGAPEALLVLFNGFDDDMPFVGVALAALSRRIPNIFAMLPDAFPYGSDYVIARTPSREYTVAQVADLLADVGLADARARIARAKTPFAEWNYSYTGVPRFRVHQVHATNQKTALAMSFYRDMAPVGEDDYWPEATPVYGSGDGTVPLIALESVPRYWKENGADITITVDNSSNHRTVPRSRTFIDIVKHYACSL